MLRGTGGSLLNLLLKFFYTDTCLRNLLQINFLKLKGKSNNEVTDLCLNKLLKKFA